MAKTERFDGVIIVLLLAGVAAGSRRYYTHRRPAREE